MRALYLLILSVSVFVGCTKQEPAGIAINEIFPDGRVRALARAAARGNIPEMDRILSEGINVNSQGKSGITPLWWALAETNYIGFTHLLEKKADPNVQVKDGYDNVMYQAAMVEPSRFLEAAIKAGGNVNLISAVQSSQLSHALSEGKTPLFAAITMHNRTNVAILLNAGANINFQDTTGITPLINAGFSDDFEIMYFLLTKGAKVDLKDNVGHTVVWSIENSNISKQGIQFQWRQKVIDLLKTQGVSINQM